MSPQHDPQIPDLVGLTGAADILGVTRQAVHLMYQRGELAGAPLEGPETRKTLVFRREVVEEFKRARDAAVEDG